MPRFISFLLISLVFLGAGAEALGEPSPPIANDLAIGELILDLETASDARARYGLYLPTNFDASRGWPVLMILDPRGNVTWALEHFRSTAERYGYVLAATYDSRSDYGGSGAYEVTGEIIQDLVRRLPVARGRVYFTGMSGTARSAFLLGRALRPLTGGVLGCAAGLFDEPEDEALGFAYVGTVGLEDFNYDELIAVDKQLDSIDDIPHRLEIFEGAHGWPPTATLERAVGFFEVQAMLRGTRPVDAELISRLYRQDLERIDALEAIDAVSAIDLARSTAEAYSQLVTSTTANERMNELEASPDMRHAEKQRRRLVRLERGYRATVGRWRSTFMDATQSLLPHERSLGQLQIKPLLKATEDPDQAVARSARRRLGTAFAQTNYYVPVPLATRGDFPRAAASLDIAVEMRPEQPSLRIRAARAHARAHHPARALRHLEKAASLGFQDAALLRDDEAFLALAKRDDFEAVLVAMEGATKSGED